MNVNTLRDEFSALLGDSSTAFKSKVLTWMNDIEKEICASHGWPFLRVKAKKALTASQEIQSLVFSTPNSPIATNAVGGNLTASTSYTIKVSFYDSTFDIESLPSAAVSVSTTAPNKTINLTGIPLSSDPNCNARRVYLSKAGGEYYLASTIANNTATTLSITEDTTSYVIPEQESYIDNLDGSPYFETDNQRKLKYYSMERLRSSFPDTTSTGTPDSWSDFSNDKVVLYPIPESAYNLSFLFFKKPRGLFQGENTTLPVFLKDVLEAGVEAKGYKYRDRDGYVTKQQVYEAKLRDMIEKYGKSFKGPQRVRDVNSNSDGFSL